MTTAAGKRPRSSTSASNTGNNTGNNTVVAPIRLLANNSDDASPWSITLRQLLGFDSSSFEQPSCGMDWLVVANYLVDPAFLIDEIPELLSVPCTTVFYGQADTSFQPWQQAVGSEALDLRCLLPSEPAGSPTNPTAHKIPYGVHHTKLFLVGFCNDTLRVVIHTANLRPSDIHAKAQGVFFQDFSPKTSPASTTASSPSNNTSSSSSPFEDGLLDYLDTYRYTTPRIWKPGTSPAFLRGVLKRYDFSTAKAVLIPSTPGYHRLDAPRGHLQVRRAVQQYTSTPSSTCSQGHADESPSQAKKPPAPIVCQFSSMGSLTEKYLHEMQASFDTQLARRPLTQTTWTATTKKTTLPPLHLQLVYPTVTEIRDSIEGYRGGASVPGRSTNVSKSFLRPLYHTWSGGKGKDTTAAVSSPLWKARQVPHIKTYFQLADGGDSLSYLVLGSHNLSKAAWGAIQKDGRSGGVRLFIRHWELSVLVSPTTLGSERLVPWTAEQSEDSLRPGDCRVPLPYCHRPNRYAAQDVPWAVDLRYPEADAFGRYMVE